MYVFVATLPERLQSSLLRYIQSFDACSLGIRSQYFFHHSAMGSPLSFPLMSHLPCIEIVSVITLSSARFGRGFCIQPAEGDPRVLASPAGGWCIDRALRVGRMTHICLPEQIARDKRYKASVHEGDEGGSRRPPEVAPAVFV